MREHRAIKYTDQLTNRRDLHDLKCIIVSVCTNELGRKQHYHKIKSPIWCSAESCTFRPHWKRVDFRGIKPWNTLESDPKTYIISSTITRLMGSSRGFDDWNCLREKESYRCWSNLFAGVVPCLFIISQKDRDEKVAQRLANGRIYHHLPTTPSLSWLWAYHK